MVAMRLIGQCLLWTGRKGNGRARPSKAAAPTSDAFARGDDKFLEHSKAKEHRASAAEMNGARSESAFLTGHNTFLVSYSHRLSPLHLSSTAHALRNEVAQLRGEITELRRFLKVHMRPSVLG